MNMMKDYRLYQPEIDAFDKWIWKLQTTFWDRVYYVNFMFGQLPTNPHVQKAIMHDEVCRWYSLLLTREVRRPRSEGLDLPALFDFDLPRRLDMPQFFGCCDQPVLKRDKKTPRLVLPNDGDHLNGILALSRLGRGKCVPERDFKLARYCPPNSRLQRIYVERIDHRGTIADYTFKAIGSGRATWDEMLILPRALSEISAKSPRN